MPCPYFIIHIGDLHLVLPVLNLSTLDAGILIIMQQVRLMMFSLKILVSASAQGPLVLGFGAFGLRVLGLGLTIIYVELVNVDPLSGPNEPLFIALHALYDM